MAAIGQLCRVFNPAAVRSLKHISRIQPTYASTPKYFSLFRPLNTERRFSEQHEWVVVEGKVGKVGISDYAQDKLGDIVYVQLPEQGDEFEQDDECGVLESVKAASDIYSPLTGKVTEKNATVEERPELINKSCYDEGWMFKIEISKPEEVEALMSEDAYKQFLESQD